MRLNDTYGKARSFFPDTGAAYRAARADLLRTKPAVERLENRETPSALPLKAVSISTPGVLVAAARLESQLLNDSLRNTRSVLTNDSSSNTFTRDILRQQLSVAEHARDAWEKTWFNIGRPHASFDAVSSVLTDLQTEFIHANDNLLQLQRLEIAQNKILPFEPPVF